MAKVQNNDMPKPNLNLKGRYALNPTSDATCGVLRDAATATAHVQQRRLAADVSELVEDALLDEELVLEEALVGICEHGGACAACEPQTERESARLERRDAIRDKK